jgi:radical SAM superfamily enzyme YgiQ (UPF0313 family)
MEVARLFKEQTKDKHVVVGGPNLTAHKDSKFFKTHPYIDYAVYGDGEKALSNIIDYLHDGHRDNWINKNSTSQTGILSSWCVTLPSWTKIKIASWCRKWRHTTFLLC